MHRRKFPEVAMPAVVVVVAPELVVAHAEEAALAESVVAVVLRARLRCREVVEVNVRTRVAIRQQRAQAWCPRVAAEDRAEQLIGRAESRPPGQAAIVQAELAIDPETLPAVPVGSAIDQIQLIDRESAIVPARAVAPMPARETGPESVIDLHLEIDQARVTAPRSVIVPTAAIDRE